MSQISEGSAPFTSIFIKVLTGHARLPSYLISRICGRSAVIKSMRVKSKSSCKRVTRISRVIATA